MNAGIPCQCRGDRRQRVVVSPDILEHLIARAARDAYPGAAEGQRHDKGVASVGQKKWRCVVVVTSVQGGALNS